MKTFPLTYTEVLNANNGINKQWQLQEMLTGSHPSRHDNIPFDKGSDIPELDMSVKAPRFTLAAPGYLTGSTKAEMLDDYFSRVHSTSFAYISNKNMVYQMNAVEFRAFLEMFTEIGERDGKKVIRGNRRYGDIVRWFERV